MRRLRYIHMHDLRDEGSRAVCVVCGAGVGSRTVRGGGAGALSSGVGATRKDGSGLARALTVGVSGSGGAAASGAVDPALARARVAGADSPPAQQSDSSPNPADSARRISVRAAIAQLMTAPRPSSGQTSQLLRGHPADLLEEEGVWWRIRGADGYSGWCHRGYLALEGPGGAAGLRSAWLSERRLSLGCTVRTADGYEVVLPLGAMLDADDQLGHGLAMNHRARARYFARDPESIARRAVELFRGAPYQWGGVTPWGCDCSGLVQTMYALHGMQLPRDAWMQAELGREIGTDPGEFEPADLLFFSDRDDGRITHVAISLGGPGVVHMSLANGGFGINSLDAADQVAAGLRETFRSGRRLW